ncbi:MAG: N-6 DNA methylase, partial [Alphaproteobacteria bacterium]|nr:N-6 DNA methylase [Alphaproteobacteria bacterium]
GTFSVHDIQSGAVFERHTKWFAENNRVDQALLDNLSVLVNDLEKKDGLDKAVAQVLTAQVLFVAYLDDREIIAERYCQKHRVRRLRELLQDGDTNGLVKLLSKLKDHLNGDLLEPELGMRQLWTGLPRSAIGRLSAFLNYDNLSTGQLDMWGYDFRYLPVELISGVYEKFLSVGKKLAGAYYTPPRLANFVVDQVAARSHDLLAEKVYDGACGSGILLTTAFRRMLSIAEARAKRQYSLKERVALLNDRIYGSDNSEAACRVTAFSLYLSLLEGLQPADLAHLTEDDAEAVKLPHLRGKNLQCGDDQGDFFSSQNGHLRHKAFTVLLCNPPWVEPKGAHKISSDKWAENNGHKLPRRNTAAAFLLRAADYMRDDAILCWILPVSLFAAPTSQRFVADWLKRFELQRLINFGDLRKLLFQKAKQPTMVALARLRPEGTTIAEQVEYWAPKADVSFAFNRLTMHGNDRQDISARALTINNEILTTLYWGTRHDASLITRLRAMGQLGDLCGSKGSWVIRKGFHKEDKSRTLVSSESLRSKPFLNAKAFRAACHVMDEDELTEFPAKLNRLPGLNEDLLTVFKGPRVIFSDGLTTRRRIRPVFANTPFSFTSSLGVIAGQKKHEDALRFLAVYLRSDLACYFMAMTSYQVLFERDRITTLNLKAFPFTLPENHPSAHEAADIMAKVAAFTRQLEQVHPMNRKELANRWQDETGDRLLARYFGLTQRDMQRVKEVARVILPSLQPSNLSGLSKGIHHLPTKHELEGYVTALQGELETWRDSSGGMGKFNVSTVTSTR